MGRDGDPPLGLLIDHSGCHFDSRQPSDLETLLSTHPLDDPDLLDQARVAMARIAEQKLTKYAGVPLNAPCPDPGFILVIDQTRGDASIEKCGASAETFARMLSAAKTDHPNSRIVIKTHPETQNGHRAGHFSTADTSDRVTLIDHPIAPQDLFEAAKAVYVVSSQLGFEAILAGHRPNVFGQPFYMGWGLSQDYAPLARRTRTLSREQMFAAAMILYPTWYDPTRDQQCGLAHVLDQLEAETRAWRDDVRGWAAPGLRLWKRKPFQRFFGRHKPMVFRLPSDARNTMIWGLKPGPKGATRVEDGFLRSKGLGAELVPPLSLVLDDQGMYFDPRTPSRLEHLIAASGGLRADQIERAKELQETLINRQISKYNLVTQSAQNLPKGHRILVPGQVEDDASIQVGTIDTSTNLELLKRVRADQPDAIIIYKPHPDVEAGLRMGKVENAGQIADVVATNSNPMALLDQVDQVYTMTSLLGFEALLRGVPVTCAGLPFYAGWGLTQDLHKIARRTAKPSLEGLIYATLIQYPRYFDPISGLPCSPETAVWRLSQPVALPRSKRLKALAKAQGLLASYAHLWR